MNGPIVTGVVFTLVLAVASAFLVITVKRAVRNRNSSVEERGRNAIANLAIDRNRRQVWGAASLGIFAAGTELASGTGCSSDSSGCGGAGCGGGGCGGGCGG
ncbi:hypothetical protein MycrhDRAFT_0057 [Mycolicibacterium rhodesiae JS60]|nr:hypothetical protein MycrhDRAFT_0057 [Mycolicibacterium rhodesiae JS60]